jgi:hypothetical protein
MADEAGYPPRRAVDPFVAGVSDGVAHGYQAVEHVVRGLHESLLMQARPPLQSSRLRTPGVYVSPGAAQAPRTPGQTATGQTAPARQPAYPRPAALGLADELAVIFAELLARAGDAAQQIASAIAQQQAGTATGQAAVHTMTAGGTPGETVSFAFDLWNTQAAAMRNVSFSATDLIGPDGRIDSDLVAFDRAQVEFLRPGDSVAVNLEIPIPPDAPAGVYRGLALAEPGDAAVLLEVKVVAPQRAQQ